jgi:hypothetical protein
MKKHIFFNYLKSSLIIFGSLIALSNLAHASNEIDRNSINRFLNIYLESADIIGANTHDQIEIERAGLKLQQFFTADAKVTVGGIVVVNSDTANAPTLFSEFVGRLFAYNNYYSTRHNADTGSGVTVERLEDDIYKVVSFVTADHYQENGTMLKMAARYEDMLIKTDKKGHFDIKGKYFRVIHRSVFLEGIVSINGGTFEMPESIIEL